MENDICYVVTSRIRNHFGVDLLVRYTAMARWLGTAVNYAVTPQGLGELIVLERDKFLRRHELIAQNPRELNFSFDPPFDVIATPLYLQFLGRLIEEERTLFIKGVSIGYNALQKSLEDRTR